jgi:hypothetical protein
LAQGRYKLTKLNVHTRGYSNKVLAHHSRVKMSWTFWPHFGNSEVKHGNR